MHETLYIIKQPILHCHVMEELTTNVQPLLAGAELATSCAKDIYKQSTS